MTDTSPPPAEPTPPNEAARIRRLEALLRIDERLSKLEEGVSKPTATGRFGRFGPTTIIALLGIVPPLTTAVYGAVSGIYAQRLKSDEAKAARIQEYLEIAIDHEVPYINRQSMLRYLAGTADKDTRRWAKEEIAKLDEEIEATKASQAETNAAIDANRDKMRDVDEEIERTIIEKEKKMEEGDGADVERLLQELHEKRSVLDFELTQERKRLDELALKIADAPILTPRRAEAKSDDDKTVIQVATNTTRGSAEYDQKLLVKRGFDDAEIYLRGKFYVVAVGPYPDREAAREQLFAAGSVLGRGAILRLFSAWCPHPEDDNGVFTCDR